MSIRLLSLLLLCSSAAFAGPTRVVLVLLDDVGVDRLGCYGLAADPPVTPHLDRLAAEGLRFERVWAQPYCGPSRAALLTGRFAFRTGIGTNVEHGRGARGLELEEWTLPEFLRAGSGEGVRTAAFGKWHLASFDQGDDQARAQGFERAALTQGNLGDYEHFTKYVDGRGVPVHRYATTDTIEDALAWLAGMGEEDSWFLYLPLHASHVPFHVPPSELITRSKLESDADKHKAAIEAADHELGRLLAALPEGTTVFVLGDNGTPRPAVEPPFLPEHAKGTLYSGSLRVPLLVWGAAVPRPGVSSALVSSVDLLPTICSLFGVDAAALLPEGRVLDGVDLGAVLRDPKAQGPRRVLFAERFSPNHSPRPEHLWRAVSDGHFALIRNETRGRDRLYDLSQDPHEESDLLDGGGGSEEVRRAHERLAQALEEITGG